MTTLITQQELEHLSEAELRAKFSQILDDLARRGKSAQECPLVMASLETIRRTLLRKRSRAPKP